MVKQATGLQGRMFNPANRRQGTYTAGSYQAPSSPAPMSISVGASKNTAIQDNMNPQNNPWAWDKPSNPQAQPVAMVASKPIPRQPKPVAPKPQYTPSNMNFRNGQYYGRGNIATWGDQIAEERARLEHNFNLAPNKARWQQAYDERTKALDELENKWNQFNNLRQSNRLTYDKANNQYTGDYNNFRNERNLLNMAKSMYSPEQLKKSIGGYDQRLEALDNYLNKAIDTGSIEGVSYDPSKSLGRYHFSYKLPSDTAGWIYAAEKDRLDRLYSKTPAATDAWIDVRRRLGSLEGGYNAYRDLKTGQGGLDYNPWTGVEQPYDRPDYPQDAEPKDIFTALMESTYERCHPFHIPKPNDPNDPNKGFKGFY